MFVAEVAGSFSPAVPSGDPRGACRCGGSGSVLLGAAILGVKLRSQVFYLTLHLQSSLPTSNHSDRTHESRRPPQADYWSFSNGCRTCRSESTWFSSWASFFSRSKSLGFPAAVLTHPPPLLTTTVSFAWPHSSHMQRKTARTMHKVGRWGHRLPDWREERSPRLAASAVARLVQVELDAFDLRHPL